jgi:protein-S-isoprenylcysteine O-methyltransferase Ste14
MNAPGRGGAEHSERTRSLVLVLLAPIFLVALPALFIGLGARLDEQLRWAPVPPEPANLILGIPLVLIGGGLGLWSNYRLFTTGRGTPLPVMPTHVLIVDPPYTRTRNPMALGAILLYLGVAVLVRSPGAALLVLLCTAGLLTYIRFAEEPVLAARFGQEYVDYRRRTPFLVPRPRLRP